MVAVFLAVFFGAAFPFTAGSLAFAASAGTSARTDVLYGSN
jgi:hypothetical protein